MATSQNRQFSFTICFCFCVNDVRSSCRSPSSSRSSTSSPSWGEVDVGTSLVVHNLYLHHKTAAGNSLSDPSACPSPTFVALAIWRFEDCWPACEAGKMSYAYLFKYIIIGDTGEWQLPTFVYRMSHLESRRETFTKLWKYFLTEGNIDSIDLF